MQMPPDLTKGGLGTTALLVTPLFYVHIEAQIIYYLKIGSPERAV